MLNEKIIKTEAVEFEGYAVTVTLPNAIDKYATSFLHIFNNVRESRELFKVDNYGWNNDVTVYCEIESKEALIEYLENFGEIKSVKKVLMSQLIDEPDYDFHKYDDYVIVPYFD